jgi:hypothetical protein
MGMGRSLPLPADFNRVSQTEPSNLSMVDLSRKRALDLLFFHAFKKQLCSGQI